MDTTTTTQQVTAVYSVDDDGSTWLVRLAEAEQCHTFGRTFAKARAHIQEAAALWYDVAYGSLEVIDQLPPSYQEVLDDLAEARRKAEASTAEVKARTLDAIRALRNHLDLSERDVAGFVGLSHQRVHQLVTEDA